jgi:protein SCO1
MTNKEGKGMKKWGILAGILHVLVATLFIPQTLFATMSLDQKIGQYLPKGLEFTDEHGKKVKLDSLITKPTVFAPVYFGCPGVCPAILSGLGQVAEDIPFLKPGQDFQLVTISFDDQDTDSIALDKKKNYVAALQKPMPDDAWKFLVGNQKNINAFLNAVGFSVDRIGDDFDHPVALVIVSGQGQIVRYLHGVKYVPLDLGLGISEAAKGQLGSPSSRVLSYCFSYDTSKKSYVFDVLKVTGTLMAVVIVGFMAFLWFSGKRKKASPNG